PSCCSKPTCRRKSPWKWLSGRRASSVATSPASSSTACWARFIGIPTLGRNVVAEPTALRLAGKPVAAAVLERVAADVAAMPAPPRLVFVRVGEDPASASYVRSKERSALKTGIDASTIVLDESTSQAELEQLLSRLSADDSVDGILLQLPLPA